MDGHRLLNLLLMTADHASSLPANSPMRGAFMDTLLQLFVSLASNPALQQFLLQLLLNLIPKT